MIIRNVCVGKWVDAGWNANLQTLHLEGNLANAASSLVATPNDQSSATDFSLKKDSPAWGLSFRKIPTEKIGLREDELRRDLKRIKPAAVR